MHYSRLFILLSAILFLLACNRHTTAPTGDGGYNYTPTKSTDPYAYNAKPNDPIVQSPPSTQDTVVIVIETPKTDTLPTQADPFIQPEPWMTPSPGTYLVAKIRRTGCYGTCPIYIGAVYSDGKAFYYGERFVENMGYFEGKASMAQLNGLIKLTYQNNFYDMATLYPTDGKYIVDLPTKYIHFNSSINKKTITDKGNAPEELSVLEEALQTLLNSIEWKPIKN